MLAKAYRLKKNYQFVYVYKKGKSIKGRLIVLVYARKNGGATVGFSVSNKIGKAVLRNKVRRRLRHAVKEVLGHIPRGYSYIIVARQAAATASYKELLSSVSTAFSKVS